MEESEGIALFETLIPLAGLAVIIVLGVILMVFQFQRSLYRQRLAQEDMRATHQQALLKNAIAIQENERQRIAQDLHDDLGARLSLLLMQLKQVHELSDNEQQDKLPFLLPQVENQLEEALESTKRISYELLPPQLVNLGLSKALLFSVEEARKLNGPQINLSVSGNLELASKPAQLGLYRMISELLNNTLKHAHAEQVTIHVTLRDEQLVCTYEDDGVGLPKKTEHHGLGLQNLEGRVTALEGSLTLDTKRKTGFYATISIPIADS